MAQRFSGSVPNPGPSGPPPQRYAPPQTTGMRQYPGQNFPVIIYFMMYISTDH